MPLLRRWPAGSQSPARLGRRTISGPYPIATCHFCQESSRIVPPPTQQEQQQQQQDQSSAHTAVYQDRISHGHPDAWFCSACQCTNRKDPTQKGGMSNWEPGMADPRLNQHSFERRGTTPSSALFAASSSSSSPNPFCHTCLTNQSLIVTMLANYLPDEEDPTFQTAMSSLPSYRASLLTRYPPVCSNCKPAVDDALSQSNRIAKQEAMRHFLARGKQSAEARSANGAGPGGRTGPGSKWKGKGKATDADSLYLGRVSIFVDAVWLTRGVAWTATNTASLLIPILLIANLEPVRAKLDALLLSPYTIGIALVSLLWTAWNPRWKRIVRLQRRGSDVRLVGQRNWARAHLVLWAMRLCFVAVCWLVLAKPDKSSRLGTSLILFREQVKLHPSMLLWVSLVFIVLQVVLHSYAFRTLKFRYGPRLDWRGKDRNNPDAFAAVSSSTVDPAAAFSTALDFQSSGNPHPASSSIPAFGQAPNGNAANGLDALFERNPAHYPSTNRGAEDRDEEEEDGPSGGRGSDAMDWSPTEEKTEVASHQRAAPRNGFAAWASSSTSPSATATNGSRTPSGSNSSYRGGGSDPPSYGTLGPQRFFVPEQPTGLEDLLLNVLQFGKEEDQGEAVRKETQRSNQSNAGSSWGNWWRRRQ